MGGGGVLLQSSAVLIHPLPPLNLKNTCPLKNPLLQFRPGWPSEIKDRQNTRTTRGMWRCMCVCVCVCVRAVLGGPGGHPPTRVKMISLDALVMYPGGKHPACEWGGGDVSMTPQCVMVCSWRRLLPNHHLLPFPWTLSLHRQRCPSATHRPVSSLSLLGLSCPLYCPFLFIGKLCQRSPRTVPVSLLCVGSTRRGGGLAQGQGAGGGVLA